MSELRTAVSRKLLEFPFANLECCGKRSYQPEPARPRRAHVMVSLQRISLSSDRVYVQTFSRTEGLPAYTLSRQIHFFVILLRPHAARAIESWMQVFGSKTHTLSPECGGGVRSRNFGRCFINGDGLYLKNA